MKTFKNFFSLFTLGKTKKRGSKGKSKKNSRSKKQRTGKRRAFKMRGGWGGSPNGLGPVTPPGIPHQVTV